MMLAVTASAAAVAGDTRKQSLLLVPADGMDAASGPVRHFSDSDQLKHLLWKSG
jgi:hypothetical protein